MQSAVSNLQSKISGPKLVKTFVRWWLPVLIWMAVIFVGSSIGSLPRVGGKTSDAIVHRVAHVIEFAVLGALTLRAVSKERPVTRREVITTVIIVTLYGFSDEFHQRFTPGRSSEGIAVLFDAAGGLIGAWSYRWWISVKERRRTATEKRRIGESVIQFPDE